MSTTNDDQTTGEEASNNETTQILENGAELYTRTNEDGSLFIREKWVSPDGTKRYMLTTSTRAENPEEAFYTQLYSDGTYSIHRSFTMTNTDNPDIQIESSTATDIIGDTGVVVSFSVDPVSPQNFQIYKVTESTGLTECKEPEKCSQFTLTALVFLVLFVLAVVSALIAFFFFRNKTPVLARI